MVEANAMALASASRRQISVDALQRFSKKLVLWIDQRRPAGRAPPKIAKLPIRKNLFHGNACAVHDLSPFGDVISNKRTEFGG